LILKTKQAPKAPEKGPPKPAVPKTPYTVRLVFAEPEDLQPGQRVFDVFLQGEQVLAGFDIVREAGSPRQTVVREFPGVSIGSGLEVGLKAVATSAARPVLCGLEIIAEEG
jgi:hypothetical protein